MVKGEKITKIDDGFIANWFVKLTKKKKKRI
jgi:hypothetical protein